MLLDSDETRLRHMIEAAREAVSYVERITRQQFNSERPLQHSVIRCIEIIGEAASRLTPEFREATPDIPWSDIIGMRNRIVHAYFDIDLDIVWQTARHELPAMLPQLEALLPQGKD